MEHIAVLDVGKTNKKLLIYDHNLAILDQEYTSIEADESGPVHIERVEETARWFLDRLRVMNQRHSIGAIAVTTHGATAVYLDREDRCALPTPAYTTQPDPALEQRFFELCGAKEQLHRELFTHKLGGLANLGLSLYFAREHYSDAFANVSSILNLPQYFGLLLTGRHAVETTFLGCHTYLYDFQRGDWSRVVDAIGVRELTPHPVRKAGDLLGCVTPRTSEITGLDARTRVVCGIHDSNASLLPFLLARRDPFVLCSTGTWCVSMCPAADLTLTDEDVHGNLYFNCDAMGRPVKTANFMGGEEHALWWLRMAEAYGLDAIPAFDSAKTEAILKAARHFILPGVMPGSGLARILRFDIDKRDAVHVEHDICSDRL